MVSPTTFAARRETAIHASVVALYDRRIARLDAIIASYDAVLGRYAQLGPARHAILQAVSCGERVDSEVHAATGASGADYEEAVGTLLDAGLIEATVIQDGARFSAALRLAAKGVDAAV